MEKSWEKNLSVHISRTISPDGRDTFESTQALSERMFEFASVKNGDRLLDLGCGWENPCNHSFLIFYPLSE
ncbi:hypothetical protein JCM6294_151 [Bacteroides pyogenes DSM 20611 = JCM 6294]|uniref:Uncharacterized protein n=1 Tax=Bacteroides pyogenes DSM 20611 = JCM 6294 TaxID=1121100 RepID=W4PDG9_9BACE|nr:hypothetical protein JCM6294_151 [Bacteroides pyogenes DSM 20611 = JCM 6294]